MTENPWDNFETMYAVTSDTEGKIVRIIEKGVIVELPAGVDGFVPSSQLATKQVKNIPESFKESDSLPLQVIEFDKDNKKIVLSVVEYFKDKDQDAIDAYLASHGLLNAPAADSTEVRPEDLNFDDL